MTNFIGGKVDLNDAFQPYIILVTCIYYGFINYGCTGFVQAALYKTRIATQLTLSFVRPSFQLLQLTFVSFLTNVNARTINRSATINTPP